MGLRTRDASSWVLDPRVLGSNPSHVTMRTLRMSKGTESNPIGVRTTQLQGSCPLIQWSVVRVHPQLNSHYNRCEDSLGVKLLSLEPTVSGPSPPSVLGWVAFRSTYIQTTLSSSTDCCWKFC